jgi:hypothetical protein
MIPGNQYTQSTNTLASSLCLRLLRQHILRAASPLKKLVLLSWELRSDFLDIPAAAVLLVVYLGLGLVHAYFFFKLSNKTFIPQAMVMGFCFSRVVTMSLRLAWTDNVTNKNLAIAATVFINAGVLLIVISSNSTTANEISTLSI